MKRTFYVMLALGLVGALALSGCSSMGENTKRGAVGGALLGSIAGGVIGYQTGHPLAGAAIGAGVGAAGGGAIGNTIDNKEARSKDEILTSGEKLGISDVIILAKSGMSDDAIIDKIVKTGSVYTLSVEEVTALQKEGVSNRVVNYMMGTKR
jgi:uncharacterized protein YcfJ